MLSLFPSWPHSTLSLTPYYKSLSQSVSQSVSRSVGQSVSQ